MAMREASRWSTRETEFESLDKRESVGVQRCCPAISEPARDRIFLQVATVTDPFFLTGKMPVQTFARCWVRTSDFLRVKQALYH